jgi:hypothetical protein
MAILNNKQTENSMLTDERKYFNKFKLEENYYKLRKSRKIQDSTNNLHVMSN